MGLGYLAFEDKQNGKQNGHIFFPPHVYSPANILHSCSLAIQNIILLVHASVNLYDTAENW